MNNQEIINKAIKKAEKNGFVFDPRAMMLPENSFKGFLLNQDFLKAFWVDWKYHAQQMVVSDDPVQYLERFLDS